MSAGKFLRVLLAGLLLYWVSYTSSAQIQIDDDLEDEVDTFAVDTVAIDLTIAQLFRAMPDSLLPTLSKNDRLDMIDFKEFGMKSEVLNRLGGRSEITELTDDSLCVKVSDALTVTLLLLSPLDSIESGDQVICFVRTYGTDETMRQSVTSYYTTQWHEMNQIPPLSDADNKRIHALDLQTILNWENDILKKD
jgi:hypothetical protein